MSNLSCNRFKRLPIGAISLLVAMIYLGAGGTARGATLTNGWKVNADGSWNTVGNWSNAIPNAATTEALFGSVITAAHIVTLNGNETVGNLTFNSAFQYTIALSGGNKLTLSQSSFANTFDQLGSGAVLITAPMALGSTTTLWGGSGTGTVTVNGVVSGTAGITKSGGWTLVLGGANTYSGNTTIDGGIVSVGADSGLGTAPGSTVANSISLDNGGTLQATANFNLSSTRGITLGSGGGNISVTAAAAGSALSYLGVITGPGSLTKSGIGALYLDSANTYLGITTITGGGSLSIKSDSGLGTAPGSAVANSITLDGGTLNSGVTTTITLNANRGITLTANNGAINTFPNFTVNYGGIITGSGSLNTTNSGTLALSGANTYTGSTIINDGTLKLSGGAAIPDSSAVSLANLATAILDLNNSSETIGSLSGVAGGAASFIKLGTGTLTVDQSVDGVYNGIISGTGSLVKQNSAKLTLGGVNTYSGNTTISGGILSIATDRALGAVPLATTAASIILDGGTLQSTATFTPDPKRGITINSGGGTIDVASTKTLTYGGVITGSGSLTKTSVGTLLLTGADTYIGPTTISDGKLQLSGGAAIPNGSAVALANLSTAILDLNNSSEGIGSLSGGGAAGGNITLGSGTLTINQATANTYNGVISGTGGVIKQGAATLIVGGINTYSGSTKITNGALSISADSGLGTAPGVATVGSLTLDTGGTLQTTNSMTLNANRGITLNSGGGTFDATNGTLIYNGIIAGTGSLTKTSAGTVTLGGVNTYSGTTTITGGILSIGADSGLGTAPGSVTAGSLTLDSGTLQTTAGMTLNANRGVTLNSGGGTFDVTTGTLLYNGIIAGSGSLTKSSPGTLTLGGINTYQGITTINGGIVSIGADRALGAVPGSTTANSITLNGGTLQSTATFSPDSKRGITINSGGGTIDAASGTTLTYGGIIAGNGSGTDSLTKTSAGMLVLSGANTYSGATTISAGTVRLAGGSAIPDSSAVTLANIASTLLDLNGTSETIGSLSGGGNNGGNIILGSGTLTANQTGAGSFSGLISGTGSVVKQGSATLTLAATNTFSGGATINAGTVALTFPGALGTGNLTINGAGATLQLGYSDLANNATLSGITLQNGTISRAAGVNIKSGITNTLTVSGAGTLLDQGTSGYLSVEGPVVVQGGGTLTLRASGAANEVRLNQKLTILAGATVALDGTGLGVNTFGGATGIVIEGQGTNTSSAESTLNLSSGNSAFNAGTTINLNGSGTGGLKVSGSQASVTNFLTSGRIGTGLTTSGSGGTLLIAYSDIFGATQTNTFAKAPTSGSQARIGFYVQSGSSNNVLGSVANDLKNWGGIVVDGPQNDTTAVLQLGASENLTGDVTHGTYLDVIGGDFQIAGGIVPGGKTLTISSNVTFSGGIIDSGPGGGSRGRLVVGGDLIFGNTAFGFGGKALVDITMDPGNNATTTIRPIAGGTGIPNGTINSLTIAGVTSTATVQVDPGMSGISLNTLIVQSGTLLLGANNQFKTNTALTMGSSLNTLNLNGYSQTFASLTLNGTQNYLSFGAATNGNTFDFGGSLNGTGTIVVDNWGTNDTFKAEFSPTNYLSQIKFGPLLQSAELDPSDPSGHTVIPVPVPEPGPIAGLILIGGLLVYRERRKLRSTLAFVKGLI